MLRIVTFALFAFVLTGQLAGDEQLASLESSSLSNDHDLSGWHTDVPYQDIYPDANSEPSIENPYKACFVQIMDCEAAANVAISWNHVVNEPYHSHTGDVISIYRSCGRLESPILIAYNCIEGGNDADALHNETFSGVGINTCDGPPDAAGKFLCGWTKAFPNTVLNTGHGGSTRINRQK